MAARKYVIYCRKSTEETDRQTQSIPDQIRVCVDYAKNNNFPIANKPQDFSMFESEAELKTMLESEDEFERKLYYETQWLFIIKETRSAKIAGNRPKWKELMKWIKAGKVEWIISYSPDRQARNALEAGELIDLIDKLEDKLTLKYTNFHFEPNASGKMMLGIRFTLSKQYSDNISESVNRWNKSTYTRWKAGGNFKHGYRINEEGYHEPHPDYFPIVKEAFRRKLYENQSDEEIGNRMNDSWYKRDWKKKWKESTKINHKNLYRLWIDEFYYGLFIVWSYETNLLETNPFYEPAIIEAEHNILVERFQRNSKYQLPSVIKAENENLMPYERWLVTSQSGYAMTFNLPNKWRYKKKLDEVRLTYPDAKLSDIVEMRHIHYKDATAQSSCKGLDINAHEIHKAVLEYLSKLRVNKKAFDEYVKVAQNKLDDVFEKKSEELRKLQLQQNALKKRKKDYIKDNMQVANTGKEEMEVYQNAKKDYDKMLLNLKHQIDALEEQERNEIFEIEAVVELMSNAYENYKKGWFVRRRKITSILFSNIEITKKKQVKITPKSSLELLFQNNKKRLSEDQSLNGAGDETRTRNSLLGRQIL